MVDGRGGAGGGGGGEGNGHEAGVVNRKLSDASTVSGTLSHNAYMDISARRPLLKNSTRREKRLLFVVVVLAVLIFILIILVAVYASCYNKAKNMPDVCLSEKCVVTAASITKIMNASADPCEDFQTYACGYWKEAFPMPDRSTSNNFFSYADSLKMLALKKNLRKKSTDDDPEILDRVRSLFLKCSDVDEAEAGSLRPLWKILSKMKLDNPEPANGNRSVDPKWSLSLVLEEAIARGIPLLFKLDVKKDIKNTSQLLITIRPSRGKILPGYPDYEERIAGRTPPAQRSPEEVQRRVEERMRKEGSDPRAEEVSAAVQYTSRVMFAMYGMDILRNTGDVNALDKGPNISDFYDTASAVLDFENELYLLYRNASEAEDYEILTLEELQNRWDNLTDEGPWVDTWDRLYWRDVLMEAVDNTSVPLDINRKQKVLLESASWFESLAELLLDTDSQVIGDYLWWTLVKNLGSYTSKVLRSQKELYLDTMYQDFSPPSREYFCAHVMYSLLPEVASFGILSKEEATNATQYALSMMQDVQWAFEKSLRTRPWLDAPTYKAALNKARAVRVMVGGPRRMADWLALDIFYGNLTLKEDLFLDQLLKILRFNHDVSMKKLIAEETDDFDTGPLDANAFYSLQDNAVLVPFGIILTPFSGLGLEALDYGNLGATLGHELSHGFDSDGRLFDYAGNYVDWWTNSSAAEYENLAECFIEQYSAYEIEGIDVMVDGNRTLGENIADNGGLKAAFEAFRRAKTRRDKESKRKALPGLEHFSEEQLFFLSYAQSWCDETTPLAQFGYTLDSHAPFPVRQEVSLRNSKEFAEVFNCGEGSNMRLSNNDRCEIW